MSSERATRLQIQYLKSEKYSKVYSPQKSHFIVQIYPLFTFKALPYGRANHESNQVRDKQPDDHFETIEYPLLDFASMLQLKFRAHVRLRRVGRCRQRAANLTVAVA